MVDVFKRCDKLSACILFDVCRDCAGDVAVYRHRQIADSCKRQDG